MLHNLKYAQTPKHKENMTHNHGSHYYLFKKKIMLQNLISIHSQYHNNRICRKGNHGNQLNVLQQLSAQKNMQYHHTSTPTTSTLSTHFLFILILMLNKLFTTKGYIANHVYCYCHFAIGLNIKQCATLLPNLKADLIAPEVN